MGRLQKGGNIGEVFWQVSRIIGTVSMMFIVAFGLWSLIALTTGANSPLEMIGVRKVRNCQAFMDENYVVDCDVVSCPAGCVRDSNWSPGNPNSCNNNSDCNNNEVCNNNGQCQPDNTEPDP